MENRLVRDTVFLGLQIGAILLFYLALISLVTIVAGGQIDAGISYDASKNDIIWSWNQSAFNGTPDIWVDSVLQEEDYPLNTWYQTDILPNQKHSLLISYLDNGTTLYDYEEAYTESQIYGGFDDYLFFYFVALVLAIIGVFVPFMFIPALSVNIYAGILAISSTTESMVLYTIWLTVPVLLVVMMWRLK